MTIHKLTVGSKITWLRRKQKPGYGNIIAVVETEQLVTTISSGTGFNTDYWGNISFGVWKCFKINGVELVDGDIVEILLSETYIHNKCELGEINEITIIRYDENFEEVKVGKVKSILI